MRTWHKAWLLFATLCMACGGSRQDSVLPDSAAPIVDPAPVDSPVGVPDSAQVPLPGGLPKAGGQDTMAIPYPKGTQDTMAIAYPQGTNSAKGTVPSGKSGLVKQLVDSVRRPPR
jgi:hypothetical protein